MAQYKNERNKRLSSIYHNIKTRCYNPNYDKYEYYGGKGIKMCDEWRTSFYVFEEWALNNGYSDDLTIDRVDINGDYTPDNCRWVSRKVQANNRSSNRLIEHNGQIKTLQEWSDLSGINIKTFSERLDAGWTIDKAMTTPVEKKFNAPPITFNGETLSRAEWAKRLGMSDRAVANRILRGWTVEQALTTPAGVRRPCA